VQDFETAGPGAAVSFIEENATNDRWIFLEDANDADEALDEYGPQHPMTRALKGKKAGEKFQLPEGRFSRRSATVKQIMSKYAWRYMDCLSNWQARFPGEAEIEMSPMDAETIPWSEMGDSFEPMFESSNGNGNGNGSGKREDLLKHAEHQISPDHPAVIRKRTVKPGIQLPQTSHDLFTVFARQRTKKIQSFIGEQHRGCVSSFTH